MKFVYESLGFMLTNNLLILCFFFYIAQRVLTQAGRTRPNDWKHMPPSRK